MSCCGRRVDEYEDTFALPASLVCGTVNKKRQQLLDIIKHPQLSFLYREWLKAALSYESLLFFLEVEDFKVITDAVDRKKKSKVLFDRYFGSCSEYEVSVESSIRDQLQKSVESDQEVEPSLFNAAQNAVLLTLENDTLSKFIGSNLFKTFISCIYLLFSSNKQNPSLFTNTFFPHQLAQVARKVILTRLPRTKSYLQLKSYVDRMCLANEIALAQKNAELKEAYEASSTAVF